MQTETDPSDENVVLVLQLAASPERDARQVAAENQLKAWEVQPAAIAAFQRVYVNQQLSLHCRWLAVICFKNSIERRWKRTRMHAVPEQDKQAIRSMLFGCLDENNNVLTVQNAHAVARIARFDFPHDWPTLFEDIIQILEANSADNVKMNNLMIILNQVLKHVSSVRIGKARVSLQAKAPILLPHLIKLYHSLFDQWANSNGNFNNATLVIDAGYLALKNIRRCIVDGLVNPHREKIVQEFFETSLEHLQKCIVMEDMRQMDFLEKYIKGYVKLYHTLINENPTSFVLISNSKNILLTLLSQLQQRAQQIYLSNEDSFWEVIAIKSFLSLKKLTNFTFKKGAQVIRQKSDKSEIDMAVNTMTNDFFTPNLVENLVDMIFTWYLKLSPNDLESWSTEPEEWVTEELQVSWEYQVRPCAETYFQELVLYFKDFLSPIILSKIETTLSDPNIDILTKDSIMGVFQLSAHAISDKCNFDELLNGFFIPQALKNDDINYKVIKRRVCLIINEWMTVQCEPKTRDTIYKFITELLNNHEQTNDKVVRLTAIQTLKYMIDDWEFRKRNFVPYLDIIVSRMLKLLKNLDFTECKIVLLNTLALIVERTNPLLDQQMLFEIVNMTPILWEQSNTSDKMIIKVSIMRLLRDLTTSLNEKSDMLHEIVLPLIPLCCDPTSEYHSLLSEEGLELWLAIIRSLPIDKPIPPILSSSEFLSNLLNSLMTMTEILPLILSIYRGYAIAMPEIFQSEFGLDSFKIIGGYLSTMRDDILNITCQFVEILLIHQSSGQNPLDDIFNTINQSSIVKSIVESGLFSEMIKYIIRDSDNPNCEIKVSMSILRMMTLSPQFFIYCLQSVEGDNISSLMLKLFTKLIKFSKFVYDPKIKKVFFLGLISFYKPQYFTQWLQSGNLEYDLANASQEDGMSLVLNNKLIPMLELVIQFLEESKEEPSGDCPVYHKQTSYDDETLKLVQSREEFLEENNEDPDNEYVLEFLLPDNGERQRFTQLSLQRDPVHGWNSRAIVQQILQAIYPVVGSEIPANFLAELEIFLK